MLRDELRRSARGLFRSVFWGSFLAVSAVGCHAREARGSGGEGVSGLSVVDATAAPARRVVSLVPSATEVLYAIGAGDRVVGVSVYDDFPPEVTRLPKVGGMTNPSFEAIVSLRPDAVVGVQGPLNIGVLQRLQAMGVRGYFPRAESVREVLASIDGFGVLVGRRTAAQALHAKIERDLDAVRQRVAGAPRPKTVAVISVRPLVVAGRGSWIDEVLTISGGTNVVDSSARYPSVSLERLSAWAPEVILDLTWMSDHGDLTRLLSGRAEIPAVRDGRVVALRDPVFVRQGPRIADAARALAAVLHPDRAGNIRQ